MNEQESSEKRQAYMYMQMFSLIPRPFINISPMNGLGMRLVDVL